MKFLVAFIFICLTNINSVAQNYPPFIKNSHLTKTQFDSVYQSIMNQNYEDYLFWQQQLPQLQKQKIKKSKIKGLLWGVLLGSMTGAATYDILAPNPFRPPNAKRTLLGGAIGGFLGVNVGKFIGKRKAKNMKFYLN